jgi:sulfur relay (sulfurtransferase) complex TusBCD TusD component (DsrE family)
MKTLFIVNHPPYGTEHAFNALRVANTSSAREELADWTVWAERVLLF